jgi:hypothetical protein
MDYAHLSLKWEKSKLEHYGKKIKLNNLFQDLR